MKVADTIIASVSVVVESRDITIRLSLPETIRVDSTELSVGGLNHLLIT
jgi:hypothetical protein